MLISVIQFRTITIHLHVPVCLHFYLVHSLHVLIFNRITILVHQICQKKYSQTFRTNIYTYDIPSIKQL